MSCTYKINFIHHSLALVGGRYFALDSQYLAAILLQLNHPVPVAANDDRVAVHAQCGA